MQKTVTFDLELREKWKKTFRLKADWINQFSPVVSGILALNTLATKVPTGFFLARQKLAIYDLIPLDAQVTLKGDIIKEKKLKLLSYISCKAQVILNGKIIVEVSSTLVKPDKKKGLSKDIDENQYMPSTKWRSFSLQEIEAYSFLSRDPNEIHTGKNPVVPGMLMLLALEDKFIKEDKFVSQWVIQYVLAIKANEKIEICEENRKIIGLVDNKKCFIIEYEGENDEKVNY